MNCYHENDIIKADKIGGISMMKVTTTELQNNFGKYLQYVQQGIDIIILRNGKEVARLISNEKSVSFLTDSLIGVLEKEYDENNMKNERMKKYESSN